MARKSEIRQFYLFEALGKNSQRQSWFLMPALETGGAAGRVSNCMLC